MAKDRGYSVILVGVGEKKIQVIKEVRAITGLGLKEAKDLVDGAPKPVKEGISKVEAEAIMVRLQAAGADVHLLNGAPKRVKGELLKADAEEIKGRFEVLGATEVTLSPPTEVMPHVVAPLSDAAQGVWRVLRRHLNSNVMGTIQVQEIHQESPIAISPGTRRRILRDLQEVGELKRLASGPVGRTGPGEVEITYTLTSVIRR